MDNSYHEDFVGSHPSKLLIIKLNSRAFDRTQTLSSSGVSVQAASVFSYACVMRLLSLNRC